MPHYQYGCLRCTYEEEVVHSIQEDPDIPCLDCGLIMVRRPQVFQARYNAQGFTKSPDLAKGDVDKGIPPARPREFGGTLNTDR